MSLVIRSVISGLTDVDSVEAVTHERNGAVAVSRVWLPVAQAMKRSNISVFLVVVCAKSRGEANSLC